MSCTIGENKTEDANSNDKDNIHIVNSNSTYDNAIVTIMILGLVRVMRMTWIIAISIITSSTTTKMTIKSQSRTPALQASENCQYKK